MPRLTQEQRNLLKPQVLQMYSSGGTINSISKELSIPKSTVGQWLKDEGISRGKKEYDESFKERVVNEYLSGLDSSMLSEKYDIPSSTITSWLRPYGLTRHRGPKSKIGREDYFDFIDSEDKAYFLGFLMADGNTSITNGQYALKLSVASKDAHIIDDFLKTIQSTNKAREFMARIEKSTLASVKTPSSQYGVYLSSKHMVSRLIELGVVPRKTGLESFPSSQMPSELYPHFFRGYFDGDGTISSKHRIVRLYSASSSLLDDFASFFNLSKPITFYNNCYSLTLSVHEAQSFYDTMYRDAAIFLHRKKQLFDKHFGQQ